MKKTLITAAASLALLLAGASFAQQTDAKPEMKQEMQQEQEQVQQKKQATQRKCPQGQFYSKKAQKCMPRAAKSTPPKSPAADDAPKSPAAGDAPKSPGAEAAPKSPAAETAPGASK